MSSYLDLEGGPRALVIVSSSRSGSNLLVKYLRQVEGVASFGEIFRDDFPDMAAWKQLSKRLDLPSDAATLHRQDVTAFWELALSRILARKRWVSAKAFYYHRRGDPIWQRFESVDHRIIHLWRDSTFDQYISRLRAFSTGEWSSGSGTADAGVDAGAGDGAGAGDRVRFDRAEYLEFRATRRRDIETTRTAYGGNDRYVDVEYGQLTDQAHMGSLIETLFGQRVDLEERLQRQLPLPKLDYVANADVAAPFAADSIRDGFAPE